MKRIINGAMKINMKVRYSLTPQMKDYDRIGQTWIPYLMYFHTPNYLSNALNTNSKGFRIVYKALRRIEDFAATKEFPTCLFVGGSTAFGVGATSDRTTIPSALNSITDYLWLNFGGRAFGSTQELLLFQFYYQNIKNIKKIVLFSGLNNLVLYYMSQKYSKELGSFFFSSKYRQRMNSPTDFKRKALKVLLEPILRDKIDYNRASKEELLKALFMGREKKYDSLATHTDREDLLHVLSRDISIWKLFAESLGIELYYVLQPFAEWIDKKLSKEEEMLFAELNKLPHNIWKLVNKRIDREVYNWFLGKVSEICRSKGVNFFDMNQGVSRKKLHGKWLYVDRGHLTDEGNHVVANILKEEVI